jgi:type I restriction enzyme, S subunit
MTMMSPVNPYGISLSSGWTISTLADLVSHRDGFIQTGPFGSQLHAHDYRPEGIPVVMPQQLGDNRIDLEGIARVTENDRDRLSRHVMGAGDIVFSRRGDVTRRAYITPKESGFLCGTGCLLIRVKNPAVDNRYLSLFFSLPQFKSYITQKAVGATMPNLNTGILKQIPILLAPMTLQRRIVQTLTTYDDLIENNTRRMALLEQAARLLYEEWFVRMQFPGREHTRIIDGVPNGWRRTNMNDVCDSIGGGTPSTKRAEYWDGDITWLVPTDVTRNDCLFLLDSERKITEPGLRESSATMLPPETILMTSRASVGFFALVDQPVCTNQGFINIVPNTSELRMYLLFNLVSRVEEIRANAKGSTYPEISKGRFREMSILLPPDHLLKAFADFAGLILLQVRCLKRQKEQARQARDLLLPKLMSGELEL